jgi:DNA mismatch repair protein MutS
MFLHQIVPGAADKSYGIHVAQLAGVPRSVNERARQVLHALESQHHASENSSTSLASAARPNVTPKTSPSQPATSPWQLTLFGFEEHPLLDEIRATNLDDLSPREALNLIHTWQEQLATAPAKAK